MIVNTKSLISMTEANRNFSKVARLVEESGVVVVMKNNKPRYAIIDFEELENIKASENKMIENLANDIITENLDAFMELAK